MSVAHALIAAAAAFTLLGINSATAQLQAVGPISPDHGFPNFYVDGQNLQLAPCLGDPALCLMDAAADLVNPSHPFPANFGGVFPSEVFYNLAEGTMTTAGGGTALLVMGLFGTFANGTLISGDQFVNARIRLRIDNLIAGQTYHITTPYGVFDLVAQNGGRRGINFTSDVPGPIAGSFVDALNGPVGPTFLQWDSDLPIVDGAGHHYLGNPAVEHTITGSPFGTNFFRIQGPNVGGIGVNSIQTNLFVVVGMLDPGAPVADFAADPVAGHAPLTVNFTDQSLGSITSRTWDFGDGSISHALNPSHIYTEAGAYTVRLTTFGAGGSNVRIQTNLIAVTPEPLVLASPTPGTAGVTNNFAITGVTRNSDVYLLSSNLPGSAPIRVRNCLLTSGLGDPILVLGRTKAVGTTATVRVKMSRALLGHTLHLQVLDQAGCRLSNVVAELF